MVLKLCPKCGVKLFKLNFEKFLCPNCGLIEYDNELEELEDKENRKRDYIR